jgi:hypothetical protein
MAEMNIPAAKTYKLSWGCPRWMGIGEKAGGAQMRFLRPVPAEEEAETGPACG